MPDFSGLSIGRYHITEPLGEGGMAIVYKAFDTRLECDVAVKIIRTERFAPEMLKQALTRFEREAKAVAKLTHSNIVKVTDYGEFEGNPYLVMEYLPGGTLKDLIKQRGQISWREAAQILIPVAEALGYAHSENIIHRDIKPSNILLTKNGIPMLTDFGVAKIIDEDSTQGLTGTYASIGTPEYMAPEQIGSRNVDARVDLYALGIVFYEMITGRRPFEADTPLAVMVKQTHDSLPKVSYFIKGIPPEVEKFSQKAFAKNPSERYQSAADMVIAFMNLLDGRPRRDARILKEQSFDRLEKSKQADQTIDQNSLIPHEKASFKLSLKIATFGIVVLIGVGTFFTIKNMEIPVAKNLSTNTSSTISLEAPQSTLTLAHTPLIPTKTIVPTITSTPFPELGIGTTMISDKDGMVLQFVPEGNFLMGSDLSGNPLLTVFLGAFWVDETEITNSMYSNFLNEKGNQVEEGVNWLKTQFSGTGIQENNGTWEPVPGLESLPVVNVTWYGAKKYCEWSGRRLATSAEWEKSARGTEGQKYPWGFQSPTSEYGVFGTDSPSSVGTHPKGASPYGAQDLFGNVWEWVSDWSGSFDSNSSNIINPIGPKTGEYKIIRGGSWDWAALPSSNVHSYLPTLDYSSNNIGFRCAKDLLFSDYQNPTLNIVNNKDTNSIAENIDGLPDLSVIKVNENTGYDFWNPPTIYTAICITVQNIGPVQSGPFKLSITTDGYNTGFEIIDTIDANKISYKCSQYLYSAYKPVPFCQPITVRVDSYNEVIESNENNNTYTGEICIGDKK